MRGLRNKFNSDDLEIITVHSPEFAHEKKLDLLTAKIEEFKLDYPVLIDNELDYWHAINSEGWPSFYLIDKTGRLRFIYLGETHKFFAQARGIENDLGRLIEE